jgi:5'-methylthioadenosine phosphorylase
MNQRRFSVMTKPAADIGVFGGSGFYSLLEKCEEHKIETPYGAPSSPITIGQAGKRSVAFLPRHGTLHEFPPHMINYRANLWAMKELGVKRIIGPCATGSLQTDVKIGDFVICDQFVDRTSGRAGTFYDGPVTTHISCADPYCRQLRAIAVAEGKKLTLPIHDGGTVVVIQGPRFSTKSESKWYSAQDWEVINMTQYPEALLARELEMCYVNISLITDYDVGLEGDPDIKPVTHENVIKAFTKNNEKLKKLILKMIEEIPDTFDCDCTHALDGARF